MDLLDPFSCQLHHIAFDRLKSHTPFRCPGTQSINIPQKFYCVFFILNFTIANTVISKKSYFRLNIWWDVIYVQREQQGTKNGALGDTRLNRSPVRFYSIYNNSLLSEAQKRIYPFQCLATNSIAKQFAFKEFMRGCIKCLFKIQYECVNLSSVVQDFSPIIYYRSQLSFTTMSFPECMLPIRLSCAVLQFLSVLSCIFVISCSSALVWCVIHMDLVPLGIFACFVSPASLSYSIPIKCGSAREIQCI